MFHACAVKFDVTRNLEKFWELNKEFTQKLKKIKFFVTLNFTPHVLNIKINKNKN